ncbi:hypothetical protein BDD12DRAFT_831976 [Trichophaea hybrida]|nr:hypothetical protein BDD12DRAFT_831976 [Trichophaea hybrida]
MEQLMKRDRAAFQELVYDHFKNVEEETKKYEELNTQLQQLEEAREEASMLNAMQEARRERTLQLCNDCSKENKENINPYTTCCYGSLRVTRRHTIFFRNITEKTRRSGNCGLHMTQHEGILLSNPGKHPAWDLISSDIFSIPKTMEQDQLQLPPPIVSHRCGSRALSGPSNPASDATTSDTGDDAITPKATNMKAESRQEPMLPPGPRLSNQQRTSKSTGEGESWAKPLHIKSEPQSSQSDTGYHLYEQESLDLDDVGPKETPRKKRKTDIVAKENAKNKEVQYHERHEEDMEIRGEEEDDPPALRGVRLARPQTPEATPNAGLRNPQPSETVRRAQQKSPRPGGRGPISTSTPVSSKKGTRSHKAALVHVLEDGTNGDSHSDEDQATEPPETRPNTRLDSLLSTSIPKSPSLRSLGKEGLDIRSAPSNKRSYAGGGDVFATPSHPNTSRRQAETDPLPGKHSADVARGQQRQKQQQVVNGPQQATTVDDVTAFKINPAANQGLNYAYHEIVRDREERRCLPGCTRACCRGLGKFIEAAGLPLTQRRGPKWRSSSPAPSQQPEDEEVFVDRYGRHREAFPRRVSPPGFWESDMPDTPTLKKQHEEADRIERKKVEMRRKEAEKGDKGKFMRR